MKNKSISMILRVFLLMLTAAFLLPALSACTGTPTPNGYAPVNSQNYSNNNEINDFTLYIPVDWTLDESKGMLAAYAADGRDGHVSVIAEKTDEETPDAAAYWEQYRTEFEQTFRDFTLLEDGVPAKLGTYDAVRYSFTATANNETYHFIQLSMTKGSAYYVFTYSIPEENFAAHEAEANEIIGYFAFTE